MPAPIAEVIWIPREHLEEEEAKRLTKEAGDLLDGHLEAAPRGRRLSFAPERARIGSAARSSSERAAADRDDRPGLL